MNIELTPRDVNPSECLRPVERLQTGRAVRKDSDTGSAAAEFDELVEGNVAVDSRFAGQAQHALADDVALDLVRAAGDAVAGGAEHVLVPREGSPLAGVGSQQRAEKLRRQVGDLPHRNRPQQLADRAL